MYWNISVEAFYILGKNLIYFFRYKTMMNALGVSDPGPSAEAEMLIKVNFSK